MNEYTKAIGGCLCNKINSTSIVMCIFDEIVKATQQWLLQFSTRRIGKIGISFFKIILLKQTSKKKFLPRRISVFVM